MSETIRKNTNVVIKSLFIRIVSGSYFFRGFVIIPNLIAVMVSWDKNESVFWAILHYIFGTFYLLYCLLSRRFADGGFMEIINSYI